MSHPWNLTRQCGRGWAADRRSERASRGDSALGGYFAPGLAAPDAGRLICGDVRAWAGVVVADLEQYPALVTGADEGESAVEFVAMQDERQTPRFVPGDLGAALVPDNHRAGAAELADVYTFEI